MAVTLDGGTGLFDRLGAIVYLIDTINGRRGGSSAGDYPKEVADILTTYDGASNNIRSAVKNLLSQLTSLQSGHNAMLTALRTAAQTDLIESFHADDPLPVKDVETALKRLIKQMKTATTRYVASNTISASTTSTSNTGTGAIVASVKDSDGTPLENILAEDLEITVTSTATAGSETLRLRGEAAQTDKLHFSWPEGSAADTSITAIDASGTANKLTNGDFEDFTVANTPDGWTIAVGAAGTDILSEASTVYKGSKALEFDGDASTLSQIYQAITSAQVASRTPYCVNFWAKVDVAPAAGALVIDLHDGSNVITDEAGNNITTTIDLTTLGTTYVAKQLIFSLPEPLPSTMRLRIRLSTALSSGSSLFIDHMALAAMTKIGNTPGHTPYVAAFSGATNWALDDGTGTKVLKIAVANNRAGAWQEAFDKLFGTSDYGIVLPTSGSTELLESMIA